jgi:hypothetical protein
VLRNKDNNTAPCDEYFMVQHLKIILANKDRIASLKIFTSDNEVDSQSDDENGRA